MLALPRRDRGENAEEMREPVDDETEESDDGKPTLVDGNGTDGDGWKATGSELRGRETFEATFPSFDTRAVVLPIPIWDAV